MAGPGPKQPDRGHITQFSKPILPFLFNGMKTPWSFVFCMKM